MLALRRTSCQAALTHMLHLCAAALRCDSPHASPRPPPLTALLHARSCTLPLLPSRAAQPRLTRAANQTHGTTPSTRTQAGCCASGSGRGVSAPNGSGRPEPAHRAPGADPTHLERRQSSVSPCAGRGGARALKTTSPPCPPAQRGGAGYISASHSFSPAQVPPQLTSASASGTHMPQLAAPNYARHVRSHPPPDT